MSSSRWFRAPFVLDVAIAMFLAVAIVVAVHGGIQFSILSARMSAHSVARPLAACAVLMALRLRTVRGAAGLEVSAIVCRVGFLALFGAVFATWLFSLVTSCGGADSYGYVSASRLLRSLQLSQVEPIAALLPVNEPLKVAAPLGYVPAPARGAIVPGYPLGVPMVMALFGTVFGNGAEFYVSPVLAALAVMIAYGIARAFSDTVGASLSALFVAVTPIFVNQAIQPMSDAAAACGLLLSIWFLVRYRDRDPLWCLAAGLAGGAALLTRPVLLSAILVVFVVALLFRGRRAAALFMAGLAPFVAFQAWLHWYLYGNVLASGYGTASHLFTLERVPGNVLTYAGWLNYSATPLFLPTLVLGALACGSLRWWAAAVAVVAGVAAPYLFYFTYGDWQDTRFLLPGVAVAMIVCGVTIRNGLARWTGRAAAPIIALAIAGGAAAASYRFLDRHHTFALARIEAKYPRVGEWIHQSAPPRTIVLAFLHSGSVRFYADRQTLRWDQMNAAELSASVAALKARGWHTWAVVDGPQEAAAFWPRLQEADRTLVMEPRGRVQGVDVVALYPR